MTPELNIPSVVGEVADAFARYEKALVENDQGAMADLFWPGPLVTRFGTADYQVGYQELADFRAARGGVPAGRRLEDTRIVTFDHTSAVVTTQFHFPGDAHPGRQSQTWIHFDGAWKIVHAHVSRIPA